MLPRVGPPAGPRSVPRFLRLIRPVRVTAEPLDLGALADAVRDPRAEAPIWKVEVTEGGRERVKGTLLPPV
jgi:hypothetical protein